MQGVLKGYNVALALAQSLNLAHQQNDLRLDPREAQTLRDSIFHHGHVISCFYVENTGSHQMALSLSTQSSFMGRRSSEADLKPLGFSRTFPRLLSLGSTGNLMLLGAQTDNCSSETGGRNEMRPAADC